MDVVNIRRCHGYRVFLPPVLIVGFEDARGGFYKVAEYAIIHNCPLLAV